MHLYPVFVCLTVFGTSLRVSDAVLAYTDSNFTRPESIRGLLKKVLADTGAASGNTVTFTVGAGPGGLTWLAVAATGSACAVTVKTGETIDYENSNLPDNKQYTAEVTAQEKDSSGNNVGSAVTFKLTLIITNVLEVTGLTHTIKENLAGGASVGNVGTDGAGAYTFAIYSQTPDHGWFTIASAAGTNAAITVVDGQIVDYEDTGLSSHTYSVAVVAIKSDTSTSIMTCATGTVVITITDTNDFASGLTASVVDGTSGGSDVTTITTIPTDAAVAYVSQTPNIGWFTLNNKGIEVAASKTIDSTNSDVVSAGNKYRVVLTVGAAGASQGTGTVTITTCACGVASVIGNSMLTLLGLLLVSKIFL